MAKTVETHLPAHTHTPPMAQPAKAKHAPADRLSVATAVFAALYGAGAHDDQAAADRAVAAADTLLDALAAPEKER
jgi:hypothetical protein